MSKENQINEKTGVSVVFVWALLLAVAYGVYWLSTKLDGLAAGQERTLLLLRQTNLRAVQIDDFKNWTQELGQRNRSLSVPRLEVGGGGLPIDVQAPKAN
jgi:hypothetical protein